jgi:hypothetical protein
MRARLILLILVPAIFWAFFGLLGDRVSSGLSSRFGSRILASGDGKFTEVQPFVKNRMKDGAVLLTAACLLILVQRTLADLATRRLRTPTCWIVGGWSAFICLNIFAAIAAHTVLFWCLLFTGKNHTHNYTQWRIKQGLMKEAEAPGQAVLLGSSQTRAQIDAKVLNERLGRKIWTTELHYPGSSPYDVALCLERLPSVPVDYAIVYLSEGDFYNRGDDERMMYFFGFRDLGAYLTLGPGKPDFDRYLICGLLGDIFPLYRVWEPLAARVQGFEAQNLDQARYNVSLESDLVARAQRAAKGMGFGPRCGFYKRSFAALAKMCRARRCRLVVCCGQLNPIFERALNPALRPDMMVFLRNQAEKDANIILLEQSQLPQQVESDYEDLNHANIAARARFSQYIAETLDKLTQAKAPPAVYASPRIRSPRAF